MSVPPEIDDRHTSALMCGRRNRNFPRQQYLSTEWRAACQIKVLARPRLTGMASIWPKCRVGHALGLGEIEQDARAGEWRPSYNSSVAPRWAGRLVPLISRRW
jgi:hypothetical protein